ncbi:2-deoxy-D-gluconate 3-dehydrogenase [Thermococcus chitonophagus]|uniref:2-deoxy-D-gluconate 3-dehydrogenase n=1 Tax=Thermococcus chitonophagus TaxID=54262 RepID=A0A160VPT2_9EURY|nr:SDR family NAD(P)-dependent oxidoreductase [Thermococcus chitonophagus]ASJ15580.1 2-deoxy-D-gluconate 3-dehydrogenase [Thermococcus chitonophagus]CUX76785.1 3-oxoacyl-[acyl-carrier protein] reductase [Thermococcus chitonophagus]
MKPLHELISLSGKTALITGAASGIGKAAAFRFAEAGADLYLVDINEEGLNLVRERIREKFNVNVETFRVDLSKKPEIDLLWEQLKGREPDVLVNNAGVYWFKDFLEVDEAFYRKVMAINLDSVFWMCQHFVKRRKERGGVIINVSSIEAFLPFAKGLVHYDASKLGVVALTRAIAREYGKKIRANVVVPGGIETEGVKRLKKEAIMKFDMEKIAISFNFNARLPMGRFGDPDEVARVILFLASDLASYVNGAIIPVDGGFLST